MTNVGFISARPTLHGFSMFLHRSTLNFVLFTRSFDETPQNIQNNVNVTRDIRPGADARGQLTY